MDWFEPKEEFDDDNFKDSWDEDGINLIANREEWLR
jgi:hypothetical protein